MKTWLVWLTLAALLLGANNARAAGTALTLSAQELDQGQAGWASLCLGPQTAAPTLVFLEQEAPMLRGRDGCWLGLLGADLETKPGPHAVQVKAQGRVLAQAQVRVRLRDYGTRSITVEEKYVEPSPEQLERNQREALAQRQVYASRLPQALWQGAWGTPLDSAVVGVFGRRSLVNGQPRSPHGGVDLRGAMGTPIQAPAAGRVALVMDTFFSGLVVLIDHGLGVVSGYRHLSQAKVSQGDMARPGQVIGLVGKSGRVTGPHLHFDVRVMGARVDPMAWIEKSGQLARRLGGS